VDRLVLEVEGGDQVELAQDAGGVYGVRGWGVFGVSGGGSGHGGALRHF
jgi:hypothetical protein